MVSIAGNEITEMKYKFINTNVDYPLRFINREIIQFSKKSIKIDSLLQYLLVYLKFQRK